MHESRLQENFPESHVIGSGDIFGACSVVHLRAHFHFEGELDRESSKTSSSHFGNFSDLEFDN